MICVFFCQEDGPDGLYKLTGNGYDSLRYAASHRADDVAKRLMDDLQVEDVFLSKEPKCHPKCRRLYTNKKTVEQMKRAQAKRDHAEIEEHGESSVKSITRSEVVKIDYKTVCFLCEKTRDKSGDRKLVLVATSTRQESIYRKAKYLDDAEVLRKIQGFGSNCMDLIAHDFRYHRTCLTKYMLQSPDSKGDCSTLPDDEYQCAFDLVVRDIEDRI